MGKLENEIEKDFNLFYKNNKEYEKNVNYISTLFKLTGKSKLKNDYLPTYIVGNYKDQNEKYVFISLNPGFKEDMNQVEEKLKQGTFENYKHFVLNFFKLVQNLKYFDKEKGKERKFDCPYYSTFRPYIAKLVNKTITRENQYDVYHEHLLNIDLIPYHSCKFTYKANNSANEYLKKRMDSILEFLNEQKNIKGVIFNGKYYYDIVTKLYPTTEIKTLIINDYNKVNLFTLNDVKCIQHNYINRPASHIRNLDKEKIADIFLEYINT